MPVLINFKICDNASECNGIAECPTGALSWDKKNKTVLIDNSKCISCGICEKSCMVNAIRVARNEEEYKIFKKEIDDDPRKVADLYLDRYGAQPILPAFLIKGKDFLKEVEGSAKLVAAEIFENEGIMCMLRSIPLKDLFKGIDIKYRKVESNENIIKKYKIKKLPALLFLKDGKLLGKIEGYFETSEIDDFKKKIGEIID